MKKILSILIFLLASMFAVGQAYAEAECQEVFGGGEVCPSEIQHDVDKKVQLPFSGDYIENISATGSSKYVAGDLVNFKVIIKNTSNIKLSNIDVTDTLPEFSEFYAGPGNVKTSEGKTTVSFPVKDLEPSKSFEFFITARIVDESKWSSSESVICRKNTVKTVADGKDVRADSAQVCFVRRVLGVSKGGVKGAVVTPPTGPSLLGFIGLFIMGAGGFFLRRIKSSSS